MFIDNKYTRWYFSIVDWARQHPSGGYVEEHHIIPKSIGGSNRKDNLVMLSARQHFVLHLLLTKMVAGSHKRGMAFALHRMAFSKKHGMERNLSPREFELARRMFASTLRNTKHSEETKRKIAAARTGKCSADQLAALKRLHQSNTGRTASEAVRDNLSLALKNSDKAKAHRQKLIEVHTGSKKTDVQKAKLKQSMSSSPKVQAYHARRREEAARKKAASARG